MLHRVKGKFGFQTQANVSAIPFHRTSTEIHGSPYSLQHTTRTHARYPIHIGRFNYQPETGTHPSEYTHNKYPMRFNRHRYINQEHAQFAYTRIPCLFIAHILLIPSYLRMYKQFSYCM